MHYVEIIGTLIVLGFIIGALVAVSFWAARGARNKWGHS